MEWIKISLSVVGCFFLCTSLASGTPWSAWSECSQTCGYGVQMRHRPCPRGDHAECIVSEIGQLKRCKDRECPIDGGFSPWSKWQRCSKTCGEGGVRIRFRICTNPRPQYGGLDCQGPRRSTISCSQLPSCPVDGGWSDWNTWSECKAKLCRIPGNRFRSRQCNNPAPLHGGRPCEGGISSESEKCRKAGCRVHGGWSEWSDSTACSKTCGYSTRNQTRTCNNPVPSQGGRNCAGRSSRTIRCRGLDQCPRDEGASESQSSFDSDVNQVSLVVLTPEESPLSSASSVVGQTSEVLSHLPGQTDGISGGEWSEGEWSGGEWSVDLAGTTVAGNPDSDFSSFDSANGEVEPTTGNNVEPDLEESSFSVSQAGEQEEEPTDPPPNPENGEVECSGQSSSSASSYC